MARSKKRNSSISVLGPILMILAVVAVVLGFWLISAGSTRRSRLETLENKIQTFRRLSTVNQAYRSVIYVEEKNFWRGNKQLLFTVEYNVVAGVDFTKGFEIQKRPDGAVELRMPPSEIFSWDADETTIRELFLREMALFNPILLGDYMPQVIAEGEANRQSALDNGILERAEANAKLAILKVFEMGNVGPVVFGPPLPGPRLMKESPAEPEGPDGS